jgi:hypothetical protein
MPDKLIFEVLVDIDPAQVSQLKGRAGEVVMIPFGGTVKGEVFNGRVLPGGVDTQTVDRNGVRHMSARYMLEGTDKSGEKCHIYVDNQAWLSGETAMPFKTAPTFITDSKALGEYLHGNKFRGEGHMQQGGVTIKFYEIID